MLSTGTLPLPLSSPPSPSHNSSLKKPKYPPPIEVRFNGYQTSITSGVKRNLTEKTTEEPISFQTTNGRDIKNLVKSTDGIILPLNKIKLLYRSETSEILSYLINEDLFNQILASKDEKQYNAIIELIYYVLKEKTCTKREYKEIFDYAITISNNIINQSNQYSTPLYGKVYKLLSLYDADNHKVTNKVLDILNLIITTKKSDHPCFNLQPIKRNLIINHFLELIRIIAVQEAHHENKTVYNLLKNCSPYIINAITKEADTKFNTFIALSLGNIFVYLKPEDRTNILAVFFTNKDLTYNFKDYLYVALIRAGIDIDNNLYYLADNSIEAITVKIEKTASYTIDSIRAHINFPTAEKYNMAESSIKDKTSKDQAPLKLDISAYKTVVYYDFNHALFEQRVLAITNKNNKSPEQYFLNSMKILSLYNYDNVLYFLNSSNFLTALLTTENKQLSNEFIDLLSSKIANKTLSTEENNILLNITNSIADKIITADNIDSLIDINKFYQLLSLISNNNQNIINTIMIVLNMTFSKNASTFFNIRYLENGELFRLLKIITIRNFDYEMPKIIITKDMSKSVSASIKKANKNKKISYLLMKNIIPYIKKIVEVKSSSNKNTIFFALEIADILMNFIDKDKHKMLDKLIKDKSINKIFKKQLSSQLQLKKTAISNRQTDQRFFVSIKPCNQYLTNIEAKKLAEFDNSLLPPLEDSNTFNAKNNSDFSSEYHSRLKVISSYV